MLQSMTRFRAILPVLITIALSPLQVSAQIVEATGSRALGMGGAFVAVANDSSATWWNPGALADAPFFDLSLARATTTAGDDRAALRHGVSSFAIGTVFGGFSYYRLRLTEIREPGPTADASGDRQEDHAGVPVRSLAASQFGLTIHQTLVSGVHAGATVKYVRATHRSSLEPPARAPELLGRGDDLEGGETGHAFDLDVGILAAGGPIKAGVTVRNLRTPEFQDAAGAIMQLPRQVRAGAAFDGARAGMLPLTAAIDADLRRYETVGGSRRVVAVGVEHWFFSRRVGVRAGGRFNTVGDDHRAATGGLSIALRTGLYVDGHLVRGGAAEDEGWGVAARVSFGGYR